MSIFNLSIRYYVHNNLAYGFWQQGLFFLALLNGIPPNLSTQYQYSAAKL